MQFCLVYIQTFCFNVRYHLQKLRNDTAPCTKWLVFIQLMSYTPDCIMTSIILLINCSLFLPFIYITWIKLSLFFFFSKWYGKILHTRLSLLSANRTTHSKQTNKQANVGFISGWKKICLMSHLQKVASITDCWVNITWIVTAVPDYRTAFV